MSLYYRIFNKYLGEWFDVFIVFFLFILYYSELLNVQVLYSTMKILAFLYLYKIYHIIFVRQYDESKKYAFTWNINKEFSKWIFKKEWMVNIIFVLFIIMPWNLFWYVLVNIVVGWKLMKVWFNGNKDIFFLKYFEYDIRPLFEEYIIWYYDNIEWYIRRFINEPFLRMIMVPFIIRNSVVYSSFFSILKARMFMFLITSIFISIWVNEYLYQPWYVWMIIIYMYFLIVWPTVIEILINMDSMDKGLHLVSYGTLSTIFAVFSLSAELSVNLNIYSSFVFFLNKEKINKNIYLFSFYFFPYWYKEFLIMDSLNSDGFTAYVENDRKFSAIMFWRYEKTYTSFICFKVLIISSCVNKSLRYYNALNEGFYGRHIKKEEIEEMKKFLELYINTCFLFIFLSTKFLNPKIKAWIAFLYIFHRDEKVNVTIKEKFKNMNCENLIFEFYNIKTLLIEVDDIEIIMPTGFGIGRYIRMLKCASFFKMSTNLNFSNIDKFLSWLHNYLLHIQTIVEENEGRVVCSEHWWLLHESNVIFKINKNGVYQHERDWFIHMLNEYEKLYKEKGRDFILDLKDIEKFVKKYK